MTLSVGNLIQMVCKIIFLNWLFNHAVIMKTIASDDRMINECGAVGAMRIHTGN
jgi:hypothetical protein